MRGAGVNFTQIISNVNETVLKNIAIADKCSSEETSTRLAVAKAAAVSRRYKDVFIIGADQILECREQSFDKPNSLEEAFEQLKFFQGTSHRLISAVSLILGEKTLWTHVEVATLTMRALNDDELNRYLKESGPDVLQTVGAYRLESVGATLFDKIDGDYFTILGLPLLPLLACLRTKKIISS